MKKIKYIVILIFCLLGSVGYSAEKFIVKDIEIQGLQRISPETVKSYLPIHIGSVLNTAETAEIIRKLYDTNFFDHISLDRNGNVLVINLVERPIIGQIKISGNSYIPKDKLDTVMKSVDIAEGRVYNSAMLDRIKQSLLNQYYQLGRYNARVDVLVTAMPRNRVFVQINISEGLVTQVKKINIIGNHAFSESRLVNELGDLSVPGLLTFFTQTDRYSQEKLDTSLENLHNFYLDHGYLKFAVKSSQVAVTPDRKSIYITIVIDEGQPYHIKGFDFTGDCVLSHEELLHNITIQPGCIFSRGEIISNEKHLSTLLGDHGYIFAGISIVPKIDDEKKEVFLTFNIKPGKKMYVHHIFFTDNSRTNDVVLRRELTQMEAAVATTDKLETSKHKLSLLPFMKDVQMSVNPVPNTDDQVDVNYKVTENNSAEMTASIGYSQLDHLILSAGFNQKNFLGTGKTLGLNLTHSRYQGYYGVSYTDPYYTPDGISRTINISASTFDPAKANISTSYSTNQYDLSVLYGIPLGNEQDVISRFQIGYGYQNTVVHLNNSVSQQVQAFTNAYGRNFKQLVIMTGLSRDSRDKAIFPTHGMIQSLGVNVYLPVTGKSLKYYTVAYNTKWYHPLNACGSFVATARGDIAYGSSFTGGAKAFPYFKNYYAGGIDSVRAYLANSLGPRDNLNNSTGGNFLVDMGVGLIFPNYISDNLRTTIFLDAGNVYNTFDNRIWGGTASGPIRLSTGIEADWLSPFGLIDISLGKRINPRPHDKAEGLQLAIGANFS